jgi:hypothetical protein
MGEENQGKSKGKKKTRNKQEERKENTQPIHPKVQMQMRERKRQTPPLCHYHSIERTSLKDIFCGKVPFAAAPRGYEFHLGHVGMVHHVWPVDGVDGYLPVI